MELMGLLFNVVLVVFIVSTMVSAGFSTTFEDLRSVFRRFGLVVLVFVVAFVIRPLVGWGVAELFGLAAPAFIAMVLLASCPGAPFGAKLVINARADVVTGSVFQVLTASLASLTFAPTANLIIGAAELGGDITLPVGDLVRTVAFLQLVPFAAGILIRHWTPDAALKWNTTALKISGQTFMVVLVMAILGSWQTIVGLIGSWTIVAAAAFALVMLVAGYFIATGDRKTRTSVSLIEPISNSGPAFAAVAIAFNNDPEILGATTGIIFVQIIVGSLIASYLGKGTEENEPVEATAGP